MSSKYKYAGRWRSEAWPYGRAVLTTKAGISDIAVLAPKLLSMVVSQLVTTVSHVMIVKDITTEKMILTQAR